MARLITQNLVVAGGAVETYAQNIDNGITAGLLIGRFESGDVYFEPSITNHGEMHLDFAGSSTGTLLHFSASLAWMSGRVDNYGLISAADTSASTVRALFGPGDMPRLMNAGIIAALAISEAVAYWTADSGAILHNVETGIIRAKAAERAVAIYIQGGGEVVNNGDVLAEVTGGGNPATPDSAFGIYLGQGGAIAASTIINTGLIQVKDVDPSTFLSEAISIHGDGPIAIHNGGTIRGDYAIRQYSGSQSAQHQRLLINNSGLIEGRVVLGSGGDLLINRGSIVGDVSLGNGDDIYDGVTGSVTGSVFGGFGNDWLKGGAGGEILFGGSDDDVIEGGGGADSIDGGIGRDRFVYRFAADSGEDARDRVRLFERGLDLIDLRAMRVDTLTLAHLTDFDEGSIYTLVTITSAGAVEDMQIRVDAHLTLADFLLPPTPIPGTAADDILTGTAGNDSLLGEAGDDDLKGLAGDDRLDGADGDDILEGGAGNDFLVGGHGNEDIAIYSGKFSDYEFNTVGHLTIRDLNLADGDDGTDILAGVELVQFTDRIVQAGIDPNNKPQLGQPEMADQTWLDGVTRSYQIPGTAFLDLDANDVLVFRARLATGDPLPSWLSFDRSTRTFSGAPPLELVGQTLQIRVSAHDTGYTIFDDFLLTVGQAPGADIDGTIGPDTLDGTFRIENMYGDDGDDVLRGSAGADLLHGGAGTDKADYSASPGAVTVDLGEESGLGGDAEGDEILAIEGVRGSAFDDELTGDGGNNLIEGGDGDDRLDGGFGSDQLFGGAGQDLLIGGEATDLLDGGSGADDMRGGLRDDAYVVDNDGDSVTELAGEGSDEIRTNLASYTLGANVEKLTGTSFAGQSLTGNGLDNEIRGGSGNDVLDGGAGADVMRGGFGDDIYYVDNASDNIDEAPGQGIDELRTSLGTGTLSVQPGFENITGLGAIDHGLIGNDNDNVIDGGLGADWMSGGLGDDVYYVDNAGDSVVENVDQGNDEIRTALASYSIAGLANVEDLTGFGVIDQTLTGNSGDNLIDGGAGADTMTGGLGDDIYVVDSFGDVVVEQGGEGTDSIYTGLNGYNLMATPNVENILATNNDAHGFRGNGADNLLGGGDGNDQLFLQDGGNDSVTASGGDDIVYFGAALDGWDSVFGGFGARDVLVLQGNYTLAFGLTTMAEFEFLSLQSGSVTRFGDTANNFYDYDLTLDDFNVAAGVQLVVNAQSLRAGEDLTFDGSQETDGRFLIYGGRGVDSLKGGLGNDIFFFEGDRWGAGDNVDGGEGRDSLVLAGGNGLTHIEFGETSLTGIESISVNNRFATDPTAVPSYELVLSDGNVASGASMTINASSLAAGQTVNVDAHLEQDGAFNMFGGGGNDVFVAGAMNDLLYAAGGADTLTGGAGADTFQFRSHSDSAIGASDRIADFTSGADRIDLGFIDSNSAALGDQAFAFIGSNAFTGVAGQLRAVFDAGSNAWAVSGDIDGDGFGDFLINVNTATADPIVASDFIL